VSDQLPRSHQRTINADISFIIGKVDEAIGRNATNSYTRAALREIRENLEDLKKKVEQLSNGSSALSAREREILRALQSGATAAAIARALSITEPTVKSHMAAIYRKLGVNNKTSALAQATKLGLLTK
jgi:DNA-binding NarL/FixJ family response regulator